MTRIYKYELDASRINRKQRVVLPRDARFLSAQFQGRTLVVWAEVHPEAPPRDYLFYVAFTGAEAPPAPYEHLQTVQHDSAKVGVGQGFVFHVYVAKTGVVLPDSVLEDFE